MGFFNAVVPDRHQEITTFTGDPALPKNCVNIIINDVTSGTSLALEDMRGTAVTYDGLAARDEITGVFRRVMDSGTTLDSIIVQSVI